MVEDCERFLKKIEKLRLYLIEFETNDAIKNKTYLFNCAVNGKDRQSIIVVIHDECIFSINNNICKAWIRIRDIFLYSTDQR